MAAIPLSATPLGDLTIRIARPSALLAALVVSASVAGTTSTYTDQATRDIKALSAAEIADLLAGKGMGYAKAAELNGYPGPAHVLELAQELHLSARQRAESQAIFENMTDSAKRTGADLIRAERELEFAFRNRRVTPNLLTRTLREIAILDGQLRGVHLQAHLDQTQVLTPRQIARYAALRGYDNAAGDPTHEHDAP